MLEDKDRIFKNLYNDLGWEIDSAVKRGDWLNTKELISKGKDWIIKEIKEIENNEIMLRYLKKESKSSIY